MVSPGCAGFAKINPYAYKILSIGMQKGLFTGKKLSDYRKKGGGYDFVGARAIVNGKDKANEPALSQKKDDLAVRLQASAERPVFVLFATCCQTTRL